MAEGHLKRRLGLTSAISITVGAVIGSGIFLKALPVAQSLPDANWIYAFWIGLGVVCLFGAFAYGELGAMFPEAGGQYAFLREAWGRPTAFLYGWVFFWVINSGGVAALAVAFAEYLLPLFGFDAAAQAERPLLVTSTAATMIVVLALVNHFGVGVAAVLQNVSTFAKVGALGLIVAGGVVASGQTPTAAAPSVPEAAVGLTTAGLVAAFTGIFWAYEGWYQLPFNAAELKRPERDLPLGLIVGTLVLIATYTAVNAVYLHVVPLAEMRALPENAAQQVPYLTVARIFSPQIANYLTVLVAVSVFGAANPNFLSSPRAFYAMAEDGMLPARLHHVSPRWGTPVVSIWVQASWAVSLVFVLRSFADITAFVVFAGFLFYALTVAAVYRLRVTQPQAHRPYRCWGYPLTPAVFILVSVLFVAVLLWDPSERQNAIRGLVVLAIGVPYYAWWTRRRTAPLEQTGGRR